MIDRKLAYNSSIERLLSSGSCAISIYESERGFLNGVHIHFSGELAHFLEDSNTSKIVYRSVIDIEGAKRKIPEIVSGDSDLVRLEAANRSYKQALLVYGEHPPSFHDDEILVILKIGRKSTALVPASYTNNLGKFIKIVGLSNSETRCEIWSQRKQDYLTYERGMDFTSIYIQPKTPINRLIEEQVEKLVLYSTNPYQLIG